MLDTSRSLVKEVPFTGLVIAMPCFGGQMLHDSAISLAQTTAHFSRIGLPFAVVTVSGDSLVTRARNTCVAKFLASAYSHLVFIDADIIWRPEDLMSLLDMRKEIVCGAYPRKNEAAEFTFVVTPDAEGNVIFDDLGNVKAECAGTGFMMIQRGVFEQMKPMVERYADCSATDKSGRELDCWEFFRCEAAEGRYWSEDYIFTQRWVRMGNCVWVNLSAIKLGHVGLKTYSRDPSTLLPADYHEHFGGGAGPAATPRVVRHEARSDGA